MTDKDSICVTYPRGFKAAAGTCGIKPSGKPDLALIVADQPCAAAAVFTKNQFPGAPVIVSREHVAGGSIQAIVCNSGVSNVATGDQGIADAKAMCAAVAKHLCCKTEQVLPNSTGVIGRPLPMDKVLSGIDSLAGRLDIGDQVDAAVAQAILTTDLVTKTATRMIQLDAGEVRLGAAAKGSGMIAPNMATMLVFITTDAGIEANTLQSALKHAIDQSFNRITVDSDTSTSDTVAILASGASGVDVNTDQNLVAFAEALDDLCRDLAYQVICDGEGATRIFHVKIEQAASEADADAVGRSVANSPLVKTAIHGSDPNWGRFIMAIGKADAKIDPTKIGLAVGDVVLLNAGQPVALSADQQDKLHQLMREHDVSITIQLGQGEACATWMGCDLSREYIRINADYTT